MVTALIADIKRMTLHDGPGIRSTVFVKGCPLRCLWCHNPESISPKPQMLYHENLCLHCGSCEEACPDKAVRKGVIDRTRCSGCGKCSENCFRGALVLSGKTMTAEEVFRSVMRDRFYYSSGGGVTLSGGEPLLYSDFAAELFAMLKNEEVHTALDTCGEVPFEHFERVLPYTDLFLYDLKGMDPARHKVNTGRSNERILKNLRRLGEYGVPIEVRYPLIPGYNDAPEELRAAAVFLSGIPALTGVKVLPFHNMARNKYSAAGIPDTTPDAAPPDEDAVKAAEAFFAPLKSRGGSSF